MCFFVIAPILVAYSMGYRYDFEKMKVVATGGIYVRTFPTAEQIIIDERAPEKPGMFASSIFAQSLLPKNHNVYIKKPGYYDYSKILAVQENQVTKLENVLLIKNNITFSNVANKVNYFSATPNNQNIITAFTDAKTTTFNYFSVNGAASMAKAFSVAQTGTPNIKWSDDSSKALISLQNSANTFYYFFDSSLPKPSAVRLSYLDKNSGQISFNPQDSYQIFFIKNKSLYYSNIPRNNGIVSGAPQPALLIKNLSAYQIYNGNIIWLSSGGTLSQSDLSGKLMAEISLADFPVDSKKTYGIISISGDTFLKENDLLFKFSQATKIFEGFVIPEISDYKILASQDNKNLIFYSQNKIYLYSLADKKYYEIFSGSQITGLQWLNNDYIIFANGDPEKNGASKIIISEIDYRGNINAITLPQTASSMFYNTQTGKLYALSGNSLLVSEKLTP